AHYGQSALNYLHRLAQSGSKSQNYPRLVTVTTTSVLLDFGEFVERKAVAKSPTVFHPEINSLAHQTLRIRPIESVVIKTSSSLSRRSPIDRKEQRTFVANVFAVLRRNERSYSRVREIVGIFGDEISRSSNQC